MEIQPIDPSVSQPHEYNGTDKPAPPKPKPKPKLNPKGILKDVVKRNKLLDDLMDQ